MTNGQTVISFSVAHSEKYTDKSGQMQEKTTWVRCSWWRKGERIGVSEYLKKGAQVYVEGVPSVRAYEAQGKTDVSLDLNVRELKLIGGKPLQAEPQGAGYQSAPVPTPEDDLPF